MRHMHIWRKSILVRGNSKCRSPGVDVPGVFEEDEVAECSWNGGREEMCWAKYSGKIIQNTVDQWRDLAFTLSEMGKPIGATERAWRRGAKGRGSPWLLS